MLNFDPPLLNSSNRWATSKADLEALYHCPFTGAVTTRTSSLTGFPHDEAIHHHRYFDPTTLEILTHTPAPSCSTPELLSRSTLGSSYPSSINTLGYSPLPLESYVDIILEIERALPDTQKRKPVIFSVTGTPEEIAQAHSLLLTRQPPGYSSTWLLEINLSCPNTPGKPPPAYSRSELEAYLLALPSPPPPLSPSRDDTIWSRGDVRVGIKVPPYTHQAQFDAVIEALLTATTTTAAPTTPISVPPPYSCPVSFLSATNTLGSSLVLSLPSSLDLDPSQPSSPDMSICGGVAGPSLHPLALGNVHTLRSMLDAHEALRRIEIIGIGGVADTAGYRRMRAVGAVSVGVGTVLGARGVSVFEDILGAKNKS